MFAASLLFVGGGYFVHRYLTRPVTTAGREKELPQNIRALVKQAETEAGNLETRALSYRSKLAEIRSLKETYKTQGLAEPLARAEALEQLLSERLSRVETVRRALRGKVETVRLQAIYGETEGESATADLRESLEQADRVLKEAQAEVEDLEM